jgi:hypothetical protein
VTKFEERARAEGRVVNDLVYRATSFRILPLTASHV